VAKSVDNGKARPGKGTPTGKQGRNGKAKGKRADAKSVRGKAPQKSRARAGKPAEKRGLFKFLRDVRIEMGKVTWPSRKDLLQSTLVVLVAVAIAAVYTFVLDTVFSRVVDLVLRVIT
jgi:preprotein translocase subunit SecE